MQIRAVKAEHVSRAEAPRTALIGKVTEWVSKMRHFLLCQHRRFMVGSAVVPFVTNRALLYLQKSVPQLKLSDPLQARSSRLAWSVGLTSAIRSSAVIRWSLHTTCKSVSPGGTLRRVTNTFTLPTLGRQSRHCSMHGIEYCAVYSGGY